MTYINKSPEWSIKENQYTEKLTKLTEGKSWGLRVTKEGDLVGANFLRVCFEKFKGSWVINKLFGSQNWSDNKLIEAKIIDFIALGEKEGWIKPEELEKVAKLANY